MLPLLEVFPNVHLRRFRRHRAPRIDARRATPVDTARDRLETSVERRAADAGRRPRPRRVRAEPIRRGSRYLNDIMHWTLGSPFWWWLFVLLSVVKLLTTACGTSALLKEATDESMPELCRCCKRRVGTVCVDVEAPQ